MRLIEPTLELEGEFLAMAEEFLAEGARQFEDAFQDFGAYIERLQSLALGENLPEGRVRTNEYWGTDGRCLLGKSGLRHHLTEKLKYEGGNIGYRIRPSERGKGYGVLLLALTLEKAREAITYNIFRTNLWDIKRVLPLVDTKENKNP